MKEIGDSHKIFTSSPGIQITNPFENIVLIG